MKGKAWATIIVIVIIVAVIASLIIANITGNTVRVNTDKSQIVDLNLISGKENNFNIGTDKYSIKATIKSSSTADIELKNAITTGIFPINNPVKVGGNNVVDTTDGTFSLKVGLVSISGNKLRVTIYQSPLEVYTKAEIDSKLDNLRLGISEIFNDAQAIKYSDIAGKTGLSAEEFAFKNGGNDYNCNEICKIESMMCITGVGLYPNLDSANNENINFYGCSQATSPVNVDLSCLCTP